MSAGLRNPVHTTMWPRRTRDVAMASAASIENDSNVISSVGSGIVWKWSKTQSDLDAELLGLPGQLHGPRPGGGRIASRRTRASSPAAAINPTCIPLPPATSLLRCLSVTHRRPFAGSAPCASAAAVSSPDDDRFDPRSPSCPPPDPWDELPAPSPRSGPPYHLTEMIEAEPFVAERILDRLDDPAGPAGRPWRRAIGQAATAERRSS